MARDGAFCTLRGVRDSLHPLVRDLVPSLIDDIKRALIDNDEGEATGKVDQLEAWGRCPCGDDFCSSFSTGPLPKGAASEKDEYRTIAVPVSSGLVFLTIAASEVRYVEVLYSPDIAASLKQLPALSRQG